MRPTSNVLVTGIPQQLGELNLDLSDYVSC